MDFGEVLGRAWRIIWKHKILWIFGILAGCSRGGGGGGPPGGRGTGTGTPYPGLDRLSTQFGDWIAAHLWVIPLFILIILVLALVALLIATVGRIALIKGAAKADGGAEHLGLAELWDESLPFFWRIFLLSLLVGLVVVIVVFLIAVPGIFLSALTFGLAVLCLIPALCLLIPALWLLSLVVQQAELAIVIENLGIADGLRRGWEVFRRYLGPILIMWLILAAIGLVVGIVIVIPVLLIALPAVLAFGAANAQGVRVSVAPLIVALTCFVVYLPFLLVLNGILTAYLESAWTLTYLRLTRPKENPESPATLATNA